MNRISYLLRYGLLLVIFSGLLGACSAVKTYPNNHEKNLLIKTRTDSGSVFSSIEAALDIYSVEKSCQVNYLGTVKLDSPQVSVGIPQDKPRLLSFRFGSSGFFSNASSSISYDTLLLPRKGHHYDINVKYIDDIYNVEIFEKKTAKTAKGKELPQRLLQGCGKE